MPYQVIFNGQWSRVAHPRHYPTKPDENGYTHMVGASHDFNYYLWKAGSKASDGLKILLEDANSTVLEREIISAVRMESVKNKISTLFMLFIKAGCVGT